MTALLDSRRQQQCGSTGAADEVMLSGRAKAAGWAHDQKQTALALLLRSAPLLDASDIANGPFASHGKCGASRVAVRAPSFVTRQCNDAWAHGAWDSSYLSNPFKFRNPS